MPANKRLCQAPPADPGQTYSIAPISLYKKAKERMRCANVRSTWKPRGGEPERVLEVVSDMSGSFVAGVGEHFKNAEVIVGWFHVVQLFTKAADNVRKAEARVRELPESTRWGVLKARETAKTQSQAEALKELENKAYATGIAYRMEEQLRWIRQAETSHAAKWRATNFSTMRGRRSRTSHCSVR